jgi:hypothetical protein
MLRQWQYPADYRSGSQKNTFPGDPSLQPDPGAGAAVREPRDQQRAKKTAGKFSHPN